MFLKIKSSVLFIVLFFYYFPCWAKNAPAQTAPTPNALEQFFPFILLGILFYFLFIRPQQRRHKQHGDFLSKIKRGDEILTSSGIYGKIEGLTDSFVILEVAENVRIRVAKSQISSWTAEAEKQKSKKVK